MPTDNHDFRQPPRGQENWDQDWYHNFDTLDERVVARGVEADRTNYTPYENALYLATDTENIFRGTGVDTGWVQLESFGVNPEFGQASADKVTINNAPTDPTDAVRKQELDSLDTGGSAEPGIGGEYSTTGDGTSTTFSWDTGVSDPAAIEYVSIDPSSRSASTDYSRFIDGTSIGVEYDVPPDDGAVLSWFWTINATVESITVEDHDHTGDTLNPDAVNSGTVDSEFSTHSNTLTGDHTLPAGKGSVVAGELSGTGSVSGDGDLAIIDRGIHRAVKNPVESNIDAAGNDITNAGAIDSGSINADESRTTPRTETVAVPSDFSTISDAVDSVSGIRPAPGLQFDINIEPGHTVTTPIFVENKDLTHVAITSADATVGLDASFPSGSRLLTVRNAVGPRVQTVFDGGTDGTNHDAEGFMVDRNSTLRIDGGGANNFWRGMEPHRNALVYCNNAQFNNNTQRGISTTRNSLTYLEGNCQVTGNGDYNIRVGGTGIFSANPGANLTGGGEGIHVTGYGRVDAAGVDLSNNGTGVDARGGHIQIDGATIDNCTNTGVRFDGSIVNMNNATINDPGGVGIYNLANGGSISASGITITSAGTAVRVESPARVDLANASISGSSVFGTYVTKGGAVSLDGASITANGNDDIHVRYGGLAFAENCTTGSSTGEAPHAADTNVAFNSLSGNGMILAEAVETA